MGRAQTGRTGEDAACRYLTEQGHTILERNWRSGHLEIDIISLAPDGRLQLIGNPGGDMNLPKDIYWKILRKQLTLTGSWNSSFTHEDSDDWHVVLELLSKGRIHPENYISHRFPMEDGSLLEGFELMRTKREPYVKVMGEW